MSGDLRTKITSVLREYLLTELSSAINGVHHVYIGEDTIRLDVLADKLIQELSLRDEWATEQSLLLGISKLTQTSDAIAYRIASPWQEMEKHDSG